MWSFEKKAHKKGFCAVAGIDEAGRGPLAGPVVSAAVILPDSFSVSGITDSKKLTPKKRDSLYKEITSTAIWATGMADAGEIDEINILRAALLSMARAVGNLNKQPDYLLIDGKFEIPYDLPQKAVVKGDCLSISIAAASIVAKVSRDRIMEEYDREFPGYGFSRHKGYPTKAHKQAIAKLGPCPIHRRSFKGVKEHISF